MLRERQRALEGRARWTTTSHRGTGISFSPKQPSVPLHASAAADDDDGGREQHLTIDSLGKIGLDAGRIYFYRAALHQSTTDLPADNESAGEHPRAVYRSSRASWPSCKSSSSMLTRFVDWIVGLVVVSPDVLFLNQQQSGRRDLRAFTTCTLTSPRATPVLLVQLESSLYELIVACASDSGSECGSGRASSLNGTKTGGNSTM